MSELGRSKSYSKESIKNLTFTVVFEALNLILSFVARYLFLKHLSVEVLAIDSMMKTILGYVSFADLGITSIMTFFLFQPIASGDVSEVKGILKFYKRVYYVIVFLTITLAIVFARFIPVLFDSSVDVNYNIYFVYLLFVVNLVLEYLFSSDKTLLIADQKSYVVNIVILGFQLLRSVLQITLLFFVNDYYLFLIIPCITTAVGRIVINLYKKKKFNYFNSYETFEWPQEQRKAFYKKIGDIVFFRIGTLLFNFTDNIIISIMLSTVLVGYVSNYVLIITAVNTILLSTINSLIGTIGLITRTSDKQTLYKRYLKIDSIVFILFLCSSIMIFGLSSPFINVIYGTEYVMDTNILFALTASFFITGINQTTALFRSAFGLFKETRFIPLICGVVNIILSVLLCLKFGLFGIFIATSISKIFTFNIFDILFTHSKKGFATNPWKRYGALAIRVVVFLLSILLIGGLISRIELSSSLLTFLIDLLICSFASLACLLLYSSFSKPMIWLFTENGGSYLRKVTQRWFVQRKKKE